MFVVLLPILCLFSAFQETGKSSLVVTVNNIKTNNGVLLVAVFNNEEDFLEKDFVHQSLKIKSDGTATGVFDNLPNGSYAISVFHDENENGKMDKNVLGIPNERFGFSNNKMGTFGPPNFKESSFSLNAERKEVTIVLKGF